MRLLFPHIRRHVGALVATFAIATVQQILQLLEPQILRLIIDRYILRVRVTSAAEFARGVGLLIGLSIVIAFLWRLARTIQEYRIALIARRVGAALHTASIAQSLLLPFDRHENRRSGELLQKVDRARLDAEAGLSAAVTLYLAGVAVLAVSVYAFTIHWILSAVIFSLVVCLLVFVFVISNPIRVRQREIALASAGLSGTMTETLRNLELVKSLGIEERQIARVYNANAEILQLEKRKLRLVRLASFGEGFAVSLARALLLATMVWLAFRHLVTPGELVGLFFYSLTLFGPMLSLAGAVARFQETRASFDTLHAALGGPVETKSADDGRLGRIAEIRLQNVGLRYPTAEDFALCGIDVTLHAGETVAFVGPSGAGKSSIVKLLVGLYPPAEGMITVNGIDSRMLNIDVIRRKIALVPQESFLFAGTIRENLLLVDPDAGDERCMAVLEQAAAIPILERGGRSLDTRIGEGGLKLSAGERQRIAIARALMRDPEVIIFDEATSNLDSLTERTITATIRDLADSTRLILLVAHRLSTIAHAGRILVLDRGRIHESGTHDQLLARDGIYAAMWREQSSHPD